MKLTNFGKLVKRIRTEKRLGLRQFCIAADCDPSNWSKVERGILAPPQDQKLLQQIATILGLPETSEDRYNFFDFAAIDAGKIPNYVLANKEVVKRLPIFFRVAGRKPTAEDSRKIAKILGKQP